MEIVSNILIWIHILAFVLGGANPVLMPIIGSKLPTATPEVRAVLNSIVDRLAMLGKVAMVTLLVTGPLILWVKYGFNIPNVWFWVKMALIVVMLIAISMIEVNTKKARAGDMAAGGRAKMFGMVTTLAYVGVIFAAVFAFG